MQIGACGLAKNGKERREYKANGTRRRNYEHECGLDTALLHMEVGES